MSRLATTGLFAGAMLAALVGCAAPAEAPAVLMSTAPAASADARTSRIVEAADAFLLTLSEAQRAQVSFAFTDDAQRARWSNFPPPIFARAGVRWGDLDAGQRQALTTLLGTVLSPEGLRMVQEQMLADDQLAAAPAGRPAGGPPAGTRPPGARPPGGGRGALQFGGGNYTVAFLGQPSTTSPWMLQFGGHHLAINATVVGPDVTLSPSLTGGQPLRFSADGRDIYIVEDEVDRSVAVMTGLSEEQRRRMVMGATRIDLVLGPGRDGMSLQPEGLPASAMTDAQRAQFLALIEARLGILNADDLAARMAEVRAGLPETTLAWYGPTDEPGAAYFRIVGPRLIIEFSPQDLGGDPLQHAHNMYRDPTNEYGAAWTAGR